MASLPILAQEPRWELGIGLAGLNAPYYRGARQNNTFFAPFPYVVYRGEKLKVGDSEIRSQLFQSEEIKLQFSVGANLPVPGKTAGREGMPNLVPTLEVGPSLDINIDPISNDNSRWSLKLPVRFVVSANRFDGHGALFAPFLHHQIRYKGWQMGASFGVMFATQTYHDYYYAVEPAYATPIRPTYQPAAGFSGSRITLTLRRRQGNIWFGSFIRVDNLNGAQFLDSPLVQKKYALTGGIGFSWIIFQSKAQALRTDDE